MRQAFAGLLWTKQFYHYVVKRLARRRSRPAAAAAASAAAAATTTGAHLYNADVISMPDKWEYPWYAAWDLAFHCVPLALVDPDFAKEQLMLMLREWYMHPNGQLPAYEWAFGDVNPPVHAWAAWRVYKIEKKRRGAGDRAFLERVFHKLLLNFTWWVNRKDAEGSNVFQGGFLGLDNIGVFDRSAPLPDRRPPRAVRRHELDGDVLPQPARHRAGAGAATTRPTRTSPASSGSTSSTSRHAMNHRGKDGPRRCGTTRTASSTTCCTCPTAHSCR